MGQVRNSVTGSSDVSRGSRTDNTWKSDFSRLVDRGIS